MEGDPVPRMVAGSVLVVWALWVGVPEGAGQASREARPPVMKVGEELVYNVRYGFIDLGQIKIQTLKEVRGPHSVAYDGRAYIASYSSVPFVNVRAVFESTVDSGMFSRRFVGKSMEEKDHWDFSRYVFEYDRGRVLMEVGRNDSLVSKRETLAVSTPLQDGLSLFYFARHHLLDKKRITVPVIIKEENVNAHINFGEGRESVEIDAIGYPVDVVRFDGMADFVGFFGLTGEFEGWFSNDDARVPIQATLEVIIGSVTVELMSWKREGWSPPRARE